MLKLIVNADDFGLNHKINEEILLSYRDGILRSVSIMANGNSFIEAVNLAKEYKMDVGVHIALVDGIPINEPSRISSLIDSEGQFLKDSNSFLKRYLIGKISLDDIKKEFALQIEKAIDHGLKITHLDSHQHLHILPQIFEIAKFFSSKYSIKYIRYPKEKFAIYMLRCCYYKQLCQLAALNFACSLVKKKITFTTDHFVGFFYGGRLNKQNLATLLKSLPSKGTCELMCHPGFSKAKDKNGNNYRKCEEAESLTDDEIKKLVNDRQIKIISYKEIL